MGGWGGGGGRGKTCNPPSLFNIEPQPSNDEFIHFHTLPLYQPGVPVVISKPSNSDNLQVTTHTSQIKERLEEKKYIFHGRTHRRTERERKNLRPRAHTAAREHIHPGFTIFATSLIITSTQEKLKTQIFTEQIPSLIEPREMYTRSIKKPR